MTGSDGQPCDSVCASLGCTDGCNADGPGVPTPVAGSDGQQDVCAVVVYADNSDGCLSQTRLCGLPGKRGVWDPYTGEEPTELALCEEHEQDEIGEWV